MGTRKSGMRGTGGNSERRQQHLLWNEFEVRARMDPSDNTFPEDMKQVLRNYMLPPRNLPLQHALELIATKKGAEFAARIEKLLVGMVSDKDAA